MFYICRSFLSPTTLNVELFIARRIAKSKDKQGRISAAIVKIAILGIALGMIVMLLSVAIVTGFKEQIRNKVIGFGSHITIVNYDNNSSYEMRPISKKQPFSSSLGKVEGVKHIQTFAVKAGIIKTKNDIQGVVLKGIDENYDWEFFKNNLVEGRPINIADSATSNEVIISKRISKLLHFKLGDKLDMYFIQDPPRLRRFVVVGIYESGLEEYDKLYALVDLRQIQKLNNWTSDQIGGFEVALTDFDQLAQKNEEIYGMVGMRFTEEGSKLNVKDIRQNNQQIFDWLDLIDTNVWIILALMLFVASVNMVSGLLIMILERTNMIGILKAVGSENLSIQKIFLYQGAFLIGKGLLWGNLIGIGLCLVQKYFGIVKLDPASYYVSIVPINLKVWHIVSLNVGTMLITIAILILPSTIISRIQPSKAIKFD